jgi:hypothetical protein
LPRTEAAEHTGAPREVKRRTTRREGRQRDGHGTPFGLPPVAVRRVVRRRVRPLLSPHAAQQTNGRTAMSRPRLGEPWKPTPPCLDRHVANLGSPTFLVSTATWRALEAHPSLSRPPRGEPWKPNLPCFNPHVANVGSPTFLASTPTWRTLEASPSSSRPPLGERWKPALPRLDPHLANSGSPTFLASTPSWRTMEARPSTPRGALLHVYAYDRLRAAMPTSKRSLHLSLRPPPTRPSLAYRYPSMSDLASNPQPSIATNNSSLKGMLTCVGLIICMPRASRTFDTTRSMTRNGR